MNHGGGHLTAVPTLIHRPRGTRRQWQLVQVSLHANREFHDGRLQLQYGRTLAFQEIAGPFGPGPARFEAWVEPQTEPTPARVALETIDALGSLIADFELGPAPLGQVLLRPQSAADPPPETVAALDLSGPHALELLHAAIARVQWTQAEVGDLLSRLAAFSITGGWQQAPRLVAEWEAKYSYPRLALETWLEAEVCGPDESGER